MSNKEFETMSMWHTYKSNGGSADFETFYAHSRKNQELLVKVARGKSLLRGAKPITVGFEDLRFRGGDIEIGWGEDE
tara:strand:+ start:411 stop:641 length:231 start_codon:yes stop_codon:yes gene_type:complete